MCSTRVFFVVVGVGTRLDGVVKTKLHLQEWPYRRIRKSNPVD